MKCRLVFPEVKICKKPMDVGFLIDSSKSLGKKNFKIEKKFVEELAKRFGVGAKKPKNATLVSVATFSKKAVLNVKLSEIKTLKAFDKAVEKIPFLKNGKPELSTGKNH